jgi:hypothetical protein
MSKEMIEVGFAIYETKINCYSKNIPSIQNVNSHSENFYCTYGWPLPLKTQLFVPSPFQVETA